MTEERREDVSAERKEDLAKAAKILIEARRTGKCIEDLPEPLRPAGIEEVYVVHRLLEKAYGEVGGWKIGAPSAEATPLFAPMPKQWISSSGSALRGEHWRYRGLEAEIAFLVGQDLPPRATPYSREEVLAAMESCHPAIEELESAYVDPHKATRFSMFADLQMHGGFLFGPAYADWRSVDFKAEHVALAVDGVLRVERTGSNTSGDLLRLLPFLANEGAAQTGGLRKGQWITTGSWTGNTPADTGSTVDVRFSTVGSVNFRFA